MPKFKIGDRVKFKPKCGEFGSSLTFFRVATQRLMM